LKKPIDILPAPITLAIVMRTHTLSTGAGNSAAQHTVGPWATYKDKSGYLLLSRSETSDNVFGRFRPHLGSHAHQGQANARLIAAAPELLEACRYFEQVLASLSPEQRNALPNDVVNVSALTAAAIANADGF
jgi:hypothetical protein